MRGKIRSIKSMNLKFLAEINCFKNLIGVINYLFEKKSKKSKYFLFKLKSFANSSLERIVSRFF